MSFHKMQDFPEQAKTLNGNLEAFSVPVLVFDKDNPEFCEIGHYNFDKGHRKETIRNAQTVGQFSLNWS